MPNGEQRDAYPVSLGHATDLVRFTRADVLYLDGVIEWCETSTAFQANVRLLRDIQARIAKLAPPDPLLDEEDHERRV